MFDRRVRPPRRPGFVVAATLRRAEELREALGLRDWVILCPRTAMTSARGLKVEPRVITDDPLSLTPQVRATCSAATAVFSQPLRYVVVSEWVAPGGR